jgi:hypothetical protein
LGQLSYELLQQLIEIQCPECEYEFEIQMLDIRVQAYKLCPCCRVRIHLVDAGGSTFGALEAVDDAMRQLERTLRRLG